MVEWKKLGEIMQIVRGASPRPIKNYITTDEGGINWIKIGDVSPNDKYITKTNEKITEEGASKSRLLKSGDFILSNSMSFGRPYILKIDGCIHDGWIAMSGFEKQIIPGFLYEILNSDLVQKYWKAKANNGGAMTNLNSDIVRGTTIPIPSIAEQTRIVGILDTFTAAIDNLKQQIEQRRKQYEYYREKLMDVDEGPEARLITLGEIGTFERGNGIQKKDFTEEGVGCIHYGQIHTYFGLSATETISCISKEQARKCKKAHYGDIIIATTSEDVEGCAKAVAWLGNHEICISGDSLVFHHMENPKYIAYLFRLNYFQRFKRGRCTGAKVTRVSAKALSEYPFVLPIRSRQAEIVSILDTFEDSIRNLEEQLKLREKQYEYYRNKLLTFE